jgi:hypothetical protein
VTTHLPRRFHLQRDTDITGVSGTGRVADGVLWPDGSVALRWRGDRPSTVHWDRIADAEHVHGHHGATRIVWDDEAIARLGITQHDQPVYKLVCSNTDCGSDDWTALDPDGEIKYFADPQHARNWGSVNGWDVGARVLCPADAAEAREAREQAENIASTIVDALLGEA